MNETCPVELVRVPMLTYNNSSVIQSQRCFSLFLCTIAFGFLAVRFLECFFLSFHFDCAN